MKKTILVILLLSLVGIMPANAISFSTSRLESIAKSLRLNSLDTLTIGSHYHYKYQGHDLNVRVNQYGEVEHIGLLLFPQGCRTEQTMVLYDFLERTLLERLMPNLDGGLKFKLQNENLLFLRGSARTAMHLDTTAINGFSFNRIDFKNYEVCWKKGENELLKIQFGMDYQTLSGCDAIELDARFMQRLKRFKPHDYKKKTWAFPEHSDVYVAAGDTFLIREFRNDLYYERTNGEWHLADSTSTQGKILRNMMLSLESDAQSLLTVSLDQHSDVKDVLTLPYKYWLQMCLDEGCTPFFGIKRKGLDKYEGTVLMTHPGAGYVHLMSVEIPVSTLENGGNGPIRGYLFVYIPMHNVSSDYFKIH